MTLPFVLSRYLRPFLHRLDDGRQELRYDNGITGHLETLSPLESQLVQALWHEAEAESRLAALLVHHAPTDVRAALLRLHERAVLFPDHAAGDALFRRLRDDGCPEVPFVDQIELTNRCPMRCGFCPRGVPGKMARPTGFMELALFRRLLTQLSPRQREYRPLELHHLGESLLHPEVASFVAAASEAGLPTEMSVNPSLLTPALGKQLIDAGIYRLVLSLDGTDEETLRQLRGPAARFSLAERHIEALLDEAARRGEKAPRIVIQMIALSANQHQREEFLRRFSSRGLPSVQAYIKPLDGDDPQTGQPNGAPLRYLCSYPFRSVVVLWDGRVVPCCRDDDAKLVLGDLREQSLFQIWSGPAARELRRRHRRGDFFEGHLCHGCAWNPAAFTAAHDSRDPSNAATAPLQW